MKLTKAQLEQIIKEELNQINETEKRAPTTGGAMARSYDDPNELALSIPLKADPNSPVAVLKRALERKLRGIKPEHQQRTADEWATTMKLRVRDVAYEIMKKLKRERDPWL